MKDQPVRIGILGLGNLSTLFYLNQLNQRYNHRFKGYSTCPFVMHNTNFDRLNSHLPNNFEVLEPELAKELEQLKTLGTNYFLIPNITLHETYDRLNLELNIAHPTQLTIQQLIKDQVKAVTIFGSWYTMESDYIKKHFSAEDIQVISPEDNDRKSIDELRKKVYLGNNTKDDTALFQQFINKYTATTPVIIACTELSILALEAGATKVYDMALIQIDAVIRQLK